MKRKFKVLYTHQKTKKRKTWQDGTLTLALDENTRGSLADQSKQQLTTLYLHKLVVEPGVEFESGKYLIQVEEELAPALVLKSSDHKITETPAISDQEPKPSSNLNFENVNTTVPLKRKKGFVVPRKLPSESTCDKQVIIPVSGHNNDVRRNNEGDGGIKENVRGANDLLKILGCLRPTDNQNALKSGVIVPTFTKFKSEEIKYETVPSCSLEELYTKDNEELNTKDNDNDVKNQFYSLERKSCELEAKLVTDSHPKKLSLDGTVNVFPSLAKDEYCPGKKCNILTYPEEFNNSPVKFDDSSVKFDDSSVKFDESSVKIDNPPIKTPECKEEFNNSSVKCDDSSVKFDDSSVKFDDSSVKFDDSPVKFDDSPVKFDDSSVKFDDSSVKFDDSPVKFDDSSVKFDDSSVKFDESSMKVDNPPINFDESLIKLDDSSVKVEDSFIKYDDSLDKCYDFSVNSSNGSILQTENIITSCKIATNKINLNNVELNINVDHTSPLKLASLNSMNYEVDFKLSLSTKKNNVDLQSSTLFVANGEINKVCGTIMSDILTQIERQKDNIIPTDYEYDNIVCNVPKIRHDLSSSHITEFKSSQKCENEDNAQDSLIVNDGVSDLNNNDVINKVKCLGESTETCLNNTFGKDNLQNNANRPFINRTSNVNSKYTTQVCDTPEVESSNKVVGMQDLQWDEKDSVSSQELPIPVFDLGFDFAEPNSVSLTADEPVLMQLNKESLSGRNTKASQSLIATLNNLHDSPQTNIVISTGTPIFSNDDKTSNNKNEGEIDISCYDIDKPNLLSEDKTSPVKDLDEFDNKFVTSSVFESLELDFMKIQDSCEISNKFVMYDEGIVFSESNIPLMTDMTKHEISNTITENLVQEFGKNHSECSSPSTSLNDKMNHEFVTLNQSKKFLEEIYSPENQKHKLSSDILEESEMCGIKAIDCDKLGDRVLSINDIISERANQNDREIFQNTADKFLYPYETQDFEMTPNSDLFNDDEGIFMCDNSVKISKKDHMIYDTDSTLPISATVTKDTEDQKNMNNVAFFHQFWMNACCSNNSFNQNEVFPEKTNTHNSSDFLFETPKIDFDFRESPHFNLVRNMLDIDDLKVPLLEENCQEKKGYWEKFVTHDKYSSSSKSKKLREHFIKEVVKKEKIARSFHVDKFNICQSSDFFGHIPITKYDGENKMLEKIKKLFVKEIIFPTRDQVLDLSFHNLPQRFTLMPMCFTSVDEYIRSWSDVLYEKINKQIWRKAESYHCLMQAADMTKFLFQSSKDLNHLNETSPFSKVIDEEYSELAAVSRPNRKTKINNERSLVSYLNRGNIDLYMNCHTFRKSDTSIENSKCNTSLLKHGKQLLYLKLSRTSKSLYNIKDEVWALSSTLKFHEVHFVRVMSNSVSSLNEVIIQPLNNVHDSRFQDGDTFHIINLINCRLEFACLLNLYKRVPTLPLISYILSPNVSTKINKTCIDRKPLFRQSYDEVMAVFNKIKKQYTLNEEQVVALNEVLDLLLDNKRSISPVLLIDGVFGSGKTYLFAVIIILVSMLLKSHPKSSSLSWKLLITSKNNKDVDAVLICLLKLGFDNFVRLGNMENIEEEILAYSLHHKGDLAEQKKKLKTVMKKFNSSDTIHELTQRSLVANNKSRLRSVPVIATTCEDSLSPVIAHFKFPIVLMKSVPECFEPISLLPFSQFSTSKLIIAGDSKFEDGNLNKSLFSRLIQIGLDSFSLYTQQRCSPIVTSLLNHLWYNNTIKDRKLNDHKILVDGLPDLCLYDIMGSELICPSGDFCNPIEAKFISDVVKLIISCGIPGTSILIATTYNAQCTQIKSALQEIEFYDLSDVNCVRIRNCAECLGLETPILLVSLVRTSASDHFNSVREIVGLLTRARSHVIVAANQNNLCRDVNWSRVVEWCKEKGNSHFQTSFQFKKFYQHCMTASRDTNMTSEVPIRLQNLSSPTDDDDDVILPNLVSRSSQSLVTSRCCDATDDDESKSDDDATLPNLVSRSRKKRRKILESDSSDDDVIQRQEDYVTGYVTGNKTEDSVRSSSGNVRSSISDNMSLITNLTASDSCGDVTRQPDDCDVTNDRVVTNDRDVTNECDVIKDCDGKEEINTGRVFSEKLYYASLDKNDVLNNDKEEQCEDDSVFVGGLSKNSHSNDEIAAKEAENTIFVLNDVSFTQILNS